MSIAEEIATPKAKRQKKGKNLLPIYLRLRALIDPLTGAKIKAWTPAFKSDRMMCRERDYRIDEIYRADISQRRNPKFNGLVHGLGKLVCLNVEGFENLDHHGAIKRLQRESGVFCEQQDIDASPVIEAVLAAARSLLGDAAAKMLAAVLPSIKTIRVTVAQSLAYDSMDEVAFHELWQGISKYLIATYWPGLEESAIESMIGLLPETPT